MLREITIHGFKSLVNVEKLSLPRIAVVFGPNTSGKSNFLDAILALSRIGTSRTLTDALQDPIRGYPVETFTFPRDGLPGLLAKSSAEFTLGAILEIDKWEYEYKVAVRIIPETGLLTVQDEYLALLTAKETARGNPLIERKGDNNLHIRRRSKPGRPLKESLGLNHSQLSDVRLGGGEYRGIERCRNEFLGWRMYYLDPRVAMRRAAPPSAVDDIGLLGENIAPYLYRLQQGETKYFGAVKRLLRSLIPSVEQLEVDLDKKRGVLDITVQQDGISYSSRIISEGTLRILALCAIAASPRPAPLLAFEEPENGVQPRRLELIADFLTALALERRSQVIVTTHSPIFCGAMIRKAKEFPKEVGIFRMSKSPMGAEIKPFETTGPLFQDSEIARALTDRGEDGVFEGLALRGMLDE